MIAHKNATVVNKKFITIGFLLWLVSAVAYVLYTVPFYSEEERQRIRAVGVAVEKYEAILDAEWTDENCSLEHCPNSSKSLPGMPPDRASFTTHERTNMERHGPYAHLQPVTTMNIFRVTARGDGTVEALTQTTVTKCYSSGLFEESYGSGSDIHRIILAPSTIKGEYVVIADKLFGETENPISPYAPTLYRGNRKADPPCSVGAR